jgi:putative ABC transport system permease protein
LNPIQHQAGSEDHMFQNYFVTALRNTLRHKLHAGINILGLAIGLAACMLIILVVRHETSYDNFIPNSDNIYRMEATAHIPGRDSFPSASYVGPTKELLPQDYPEIEEVLRITQRGGNVVKEGDTFEQEIDYVDPNFFTVFQLPLLEGTHAGALASPSSIVLNESNAQKYLGDGPYLGREITINHQYERTHIVSAVMQDIPGNSHMTVGFLVPHDRKVYESNSTGGATDLERWNGLPFYVYVQLKEGSSIEPIEASINAWVDRYFPANIITLVNIPGSELWTPRFVRVEDIHLHSEGNGGMKPPGSVSTLLSFAAIATMILVIACINFMNLATARSMLRAREVAVRKVVGAARKQLFIQFETESLIFTLAALVLAVFLVQTILPYFNDYTQLQVPFSLILDPVTFSNILALTLVVAIGAGLHPALVLASIRPLRVLMANQSSSPSHSKLRSILVILQFAISAALIIGSTLIYLQTEFARSRELGYSTENTLLVYGLADPQVAPSQEAFKNRVAQLPAVRKVALSQNGPANGSGSGISLRAPGETDRVVIFSQSVDYDFFDFYGLAPVAGRLFSEDFAGDAIYPRELVAADEDNGEVERQQVGAVVNIAATRRLGLEKPEDAVGMLMYRGAEDLAEVTIVGVIPNILFSDPTANMEPEIYFLAPEEYRTLNVLFESNDPVALTTQIDELWREMFPGVNPFHNFVDEDVEAWFEADRVMGQLLAIFTGLAILVASMGLFGLSSFTVMRRTKEIGIRKVMGASSGKIVKLLIRQMSAPVIIANVIAWPFGWYAMNEWLNAFAYRIDLPLYFAGAAIFSIMMTLAIAWATAGGHAFRVARTNPIKALKYE